MGGANGGDRAQARASHLLASFAKVSIGQVSVADGGRPFAQSSVFVDEAGQRKAWVDAINTVILQNGDPAAAIKKAAADEQKILDGFYK